MERELQRAEPRQDPDELKRNEALARYDSHPGIAVTLLTLMAFLFIVISYQFFSDIVDNAAPDHGKRVQIETPHAPSR